MADDALFTIAGSSTSRGLLFYRLLQQAVNTDPHPLADLRKPGEPVDVPF
jgi:hypothetical protein